MDGVISGWALAFLGLPGGMEWIIILVIMLLLFGSRLPKVMRDIGGGVREFKKGMNDVMHEDERGGQQRQFNSAQAPSNASGEDLRVSHGSNSGDHAGDRPPAAAAGEQG
ncbi:MAG: twin-arginine translocase TatA/TatE family subunit [Planctomycetota bacterium]